MDFTLFCLLIFASMAFSPKADKASYKCLIQMTNYVGEDAYVAVSLIDANGQYKKTLYVQGDDNEWYPDIKDWWQFQEKSSESIDGITGASLGNGERSVIILELDESEIDSGLTLRFETAVENQEYHTTDAVLELNSTTLRNGAKGTGYIRQIRMIPN